MPSAVVVGAGVFGASCARALALDGWEVTVVEQEAPGWAGSSSGGESRLLRFSHGSEASYARSARRALELWREIDPSLVEQLGMAWFAHGEEGWEADSLRMLRDEGIAAERLSVQEARRLFPSLGVDDLAWVLFEPDGGVLFASRAVGVLAEQAREAGARFVRGRAAFAGPRVHVGSDHGRVCELEGLLEADRIVWACGPWLAKLFPDLVQLRPTLQEVVFLEAGPEWSGTPGWVDYDRSFYGHGALGGPRERGALDGPRGHGVLDGPRGHGVLDGPRGHGALDGFGFKAATDAEGEEADPDALGDLAGATEPAIRRYVAERFPALADAPVLSMRPCPYELTMDTHFIAAPHPEHEHVWLLGGGSGHGFKHGPALAERMMAWLGGAEPPDPRFALGPRTADRSLRTAGARATPTGTRFDPER